MQFHLLRFCHETVPDTLQFYGTCNVFIVKSLQVAWEGHWTSTVAGIYALRQLQFKRSGRLDLKAVLALDCCSIMKTGVTVSGQETPQRER